MDFWTVFTFYCEFYMCVLLSFHLFIYYDLNKHIEFLKNTKKSTVIVIIHKTVRNLLFVGIHPLLDAPHRFSFSSNYNKDSPLFGACIIINMSSFLSYLYYNWHIMINSWDSTFTFQTTLKPSQLKPYFLIQDWLHSPKPWILCWTHHPPKISLIHLPI